jgi:membrane protein DedA with SNARE-associated domain
MSQLRKAREYPARVNCRVTCQFENDSHPSCQHLMREFLNHYGLWAAFFLALIENDVAFIAVGVVAKLGDGDPGTPDLNIYLAIPAAILGALLHDSAWFAIGHLHSEWFKSSRVYQRIGPTIERLAERFGPWEIFLARFIYGTRNPTSVFWGIHHLRYAKFAGIELLALTVWGSLLGLIGFRCTGWAMMLIGKIERRHHSHLLLIAIALAFACVFLMRWFNRRRIYKIQARRTVHQLPSREAEAPADADGR